MNRSHGRHGGRNGSAPAVAAGAADAIGTNRTDGGEAHPRAGSYAGTPKLQHLRAFAAIVEHGSFSEAALVLDASQSTLSNAIADLEGALGVRLLDRGRFGAAPTDVGARVLPHVRGLEATLEAISQEATLAHGELRGHLRVKAFRSAAAHVLPAVIARLRARHPGLVVSLDETEARVGEAAGSLADGRVDVALTTATAAGDALFWELFRDPFVAVVPASFAAGAEAVSVEDIADAPVIFGNGPCWQPLTGQVQATRAEFRPTFEVTEDSTIVGMVAEGLGVALMPAMAIDSLPEGVRTLPVREGFERRVGVALAPGALRVPAVRALLGVLRELYPDGAVPALARG